MKSLLTQKRLAAKILKRSPKKVRFLTENLNDIKESITKGDIKSLIKRGVITTRIRKGSSRVRARKILLQKKKGLRTGHGSRKGSANARSSLKRAWINRIRKQRAFLKNLRKRKLLTHQVYRTISGKAKGGFFRSIKHLKLYLEDNRLFQK